MNQLHEATKGSPSLRNLHILEVVARAAEPLTATDINAVLGLPKPTIHRLVVHLEEEGYLSRDLDGRSYLPGPRMRDMMSGVMRAGGHLLPRRQILRRLNESIGETCNLSILDVDAMIYVDRVETQWPLRIALQIGSRVPLHATSAGKIALAHIDNASFERFLSAAPLEAYTPHTIIDPAALRSEIIRIREQGYSTDSEEFVGGMIAVAVPVTDSAGKLCATLSFHAPLQRLTLKEGLSHLPKLQAAAESFNGLI